MFTNCTTSKTSGFLIWKCATFRVNKKSQIDNAALTCRSLLKLANQPLKVQSSTASVTYEAFLSRLNVLLEEMDSAFMQLQQEVLSTVECPEICFFLSKLVSTPTSFTIFH